MAGVIGEAGQVGQGPADGDGEPDADLADRPGQKVRQQDAHAERDDREDDAHARALDGASISRRLNFIEHPTGALSHLEELVKS